MYVVVIDVAKNYHEFCNVRLSGRLTVFSDNARITAQSELLYAAPLHKGLDRCHWMGHVPRRGL